MLGMLVGDARRARGRGQLARRLLQYDRHKDSSDDKPGDERRHHPTRHLLGLEAQHCRRADACVTRDALCLTGSERGVWKASLEEHASHLALCGSRGCSRVARTPSAICLLSVPSIASVIDWKRSTKHQHSELTSTMSQHSASAKTLSLR